MATDQKTSTIDSELMNSEPVIENEIPTYRAISARAIFSVACGVISACTFVHWFFYVFSILAIGFGIWAHQKIRQLPGHLDGQEAGQCGHRTGSRFRTGVRHVQHGAVYGAAPAGHVIRHEVSQRFWNAADLGEMLWYNATPDGRKGKTGKELVDELESKPKEKRMIQQNMGPLSQLLNFQERVSTLKGQHVHFIRLESVGDEATLGPFVLVYAFALFEIEGPTSKKFHEPHEYVLAVMKARPVGRVYEWWVETLVYPYTPLSYVPQNKAVDDGHGHAH